MTQKTQDYMNLPGVDRSTKPECLVNNTPSSTTTTNKKKFIDPYAIYDDEDANTHYFFVPATKDRQTFMRAFQELNNMPKSKTNMNASLSPSCSRNSSGYINDRDLNRKMTCPARTPRTRAKSCSSYPSNKTPSHTPSSTPQILKNSSGRLKHIPPPPTACNTSKSNSKNSPSSPLLSSSNTQNTFPDYNTQTEDDYCLIKANTKSNFTPSKNTCNTQKDHYLKFKDTQHYKELIKKNTMAEYRDGSTETECLKKKKPLKRNDVIDACTCMWCVKSANFKDEKGELIEPCSCQGSTKSVVGRYVCMGLMAIFLPCMLCYLPAKACCGSNRKWKQQKYTQDDTYVHYHSNNNKPL